MIKKKKITHIFPQLIVTIGGRLWALVMFCTILYMGWLPFAPEDVATCSTGDSIALFIVSILMMLGYGYCMICYWHNFFGEIIITEKRIIYYALFLPIITIKFEDIKYVDIRTFDKGNLYYSRGNNNIDSYKFILISEKPLPTKGIFKIRPSRKGKLIKYAVSRKLCEALVDKLPQPQAKIVDYQLFIYEKAGKKKRKKK
ncbi:MAG: hypothetical protein IKC61_02100 [Clostridia bacterium]|nr:hypothetical protein [Clostridia bacterium]